MRVPAVVGAFPEPFRSGQDGKKLPIRLVCIGPEDRSCDEVEERLSDAGVRNVARSNLESSPGQVLRILVGKWSDVRKDIAARQLEEGPEVSGVFAKPAAVGRHDRADRPRRRVRAHARPGLGPGRGDRLPGAPPDLDDHRHRRRRRGRGGRGADRGPAALPLRARDRRRAGSPAPAREARDTCAPRRSPSTRPARAWAARGAWRWRGAALLRAPGGAGGGAGRRGDRRARRPGSGASCAGRRRWGVPFAFVVVAINVLVTRDGATRDLPRAEPAVGGQLDFTLEALVYGARARPAHPGDLRLRGVPHRRGRPRRAAARRCAACRCARA